MDCFLAQYELFDASIKKQEREQQYMVFTEVCFGDCAQAELTEYFADLVEQEYKIAINQYDMRFVGDLPSKMQVKNGLHVCKRLLQYSLDHYAWVKTKDESLIRKGIIKPAPLDVHLHQIVLMAGCKDSPGQSGQKFWICRGS